MLLVIIVAIIKNHIWQNLMILLLIKKFIFKLLGIGSLIWCSLFWLVSATQHLLKHLAL